VEFFAREALRHTIRQEDQLVSGLPGLKAFIALHDGDDTGAPSTDGQPPIRPSAHPPIRPSAHSAIHYIPVRDIRVATVQFQHAPGDKPYNLGRVRHFVSEAARSSVEIIAFPEMCLTGYWHVRRLSRAAFEALAEPVDGPCTQELLRLAREHAM